MKPDLLVFLTVVVLLGATITGMTMDGKSRTPQVLVSEHIIR